MQKLKYTAPTLTSILFRAEKGYSLSMVEGNHINDYVELLAATGEDNNNYHETEVFSSHDVWREEDEGSFWR
ncbi:MAG: hypothetical protein J6W88_05630 [Bacteroidales bacterium]|nr:hypothetical protein [Bacteroidales bacterium]